MPKYNDNIPKYCRSEYYRWLHKLVSHQEDLINDILSTGSEPTEFPTDTCLIENYLTGFKFEYIGFCDETGIKDGWWEIENNNLVKIFYNQNAPETRQRFTKIHELIHFLQFLDKTFKDLLDQAVLISSLPSDVIAKLIEKATDKAAAMYLMPCQYVAEKWQKNKNSLLLSKYFQVSQQSAEYRLKECKIIK